MRYEIRDISPPAGVRSAMELQVQSAFADHADHTSCIAFVAAECSFEKCHFGILKQALQDSMLHFSCHLVYDLLVSRCVSAKQPCQHSIAINSALLGTLRSAGSTEAAL